MCAGWRIEKKRHRSHALCCLIFRVSFLVFVFFSLSRSDGAKRYFDLLYYFQEAAVGVLLVRYHSGLLRFW